MLLIFLTGIVIGLFAYPVIIPFIKSNMYRVLDYIFTLPTRRKFNRILEDHYFSEERPKGKDV